MNVFSFLFFFFNYRYNGVQCSGFRFSSHTRKFQIKSQLFSSLRLLFNFHLHLMLNVCLENGSYEKPTQSERRATQRAICHGTVSSSSL